MPEQACEPVASRRHTIILCVILLLIAAAGWASLHSGAGTQPRTGAPDASLLLMLIVVEAALLYYVVIGIRARGHRLVELVSSRAITARRILTDLLLGIALLALLLGAEHILTLLVGSGEQRLVKPLVAAAATQPIIWILVSCAAAVAEELTFRGYLQRQFLAWSASPVVAIIGQAAIFGVTHGYQGGIPMVRIAAIGILYGIAAHLLRSRVPGIFAHAGQDIVGGFGWLG
jgi:membrane protease YdiL (CAAX protease family)